MMWYELVQNVHRSLWDMEIWSHIVEMMNCGMMNIAWGPWSANLEIYKKCHITRLDLLKTHQTLVKHCLFTAPILCQYIYYRKCKKVGGCKWVMIDIDLYLKDSPSYRTVTCGHEKIDCISSSQCYECRENHDAFCAVQLTLAQLFFKVLTLCYTWRPWFFKVICMCTYIEHLSISMFILARYIDITMKRWMCAVIYDWWQLNPMKLQDF